MVLFHIGEIKKFSVFQTSWRVEDFRKFSKYFLRKLRNLHITSSKILLRFGHMNEKLISILLSDALFIFPVLENG